MLTRVLAWFEQADTWPWTAGPTRGGYSPAEPPGLFVNKKQTARTRLPVITTALPSFLAEFKARMVS